MNFVEFQQTVEQLRALTQVNVQTSWHFSQQEIPIHQATNPEQWEVWPGVTLNAKDQIAWDGGKQVLWLGQTFVVPAELGKFSLIGMTLRLSLAWWAEDAQIFVNGERVQSGDLFDYSARILLRDKVKVGDAIAVAVRLVSPSHDRGALVRSHLIYESYNPNEIDPGFFADELEILQLYLTTFAKDDDSVTAAIKNTLADLDWSALSDAEKFQRSLSSIRQNILQKLAEFLPDFYDKIDENIYKNNREIALVGHAHLDLAWLWPVSETWVAAQRTFASVLNLQKDFPHLIFCHSTPALYEWIETHRPDLFQAILTAVKANRWEVVGGLWVEPELNIIDGESIVRQILYGQRYALAKFGELMRVAWLPDTFGFCWQLPQFLQQGGIDYFVTQKLRWNDTTQFPDEVFWWQAPDGTKIFSLMSALIGESIDAVKMTRYACEWERKTSLKAPLWLPGVGDHGGGPTRDMLEISQRWEKSPFFPRLKFTRVVDYLDKIQHYFSQKAAEENHPSMNTWQDELYLEFHRGCYTTHGEQKRLNRRCEALLYQAEVWSSLATIATGIAYPQAALENTWKKMLFNQFHDILPGSSIPEVYEDANQIWQEVEATGREILTQALEAIAAQIDLPDFPLTEGILSESIQPFIIFNSLNWSRSEVVTLSLPTSPQLNFAWQIYDLSGQLIPSQLSADLSSLKFLASEIPGVGYRIFWLVQSAIASPQNVSPSFNELASPILLENECLQVFVDAETGDLSRIFDKVQNREVLSGPGNQLQMFQDQGQYWDAWNIDPNYAEYPLQSPVVKSIRWIAQGPIEWRLQVVRQFNQSEFSQDYVLTSQSCILQIISRVHWRESHVLVKAAFPVNVCADHATYEMPAGAIARTTQPTTPQEQAKWEVPALRWADLSADDYGVSLLNDCKYGYDAKLNQLRLSLLRSSVWPDPGADQGDHEFSYALYPHGGNWQQGQTVRRGYEFNVPLQVQYFRLSDRRKKSLPQMPPVAQLLNLSAENLILMAFKQAEDEPQSWILRCYECHGTDALLNLQSYFPLAIAYNINLLELAVQIPEVSQPQPQFQIMPWKISSFKLVSAANFP